MKQESIIRLVIGLGFIVAMFVLIRGVNSYLVDKNEILAETERSRCMQELEIAKTEHSGINSDVWANTCSDIKTYKIKSQKKDSFLE